MIKEFLHPTEDTATIIVELESYIIHAKKEGVRGMWSSDFNYDANFVSFSNTVCCNPY